MCLLVVLPMAGFAKKKQATEPKARPEKEVVQEQELKYYFYEAVRLFDAEQYGEAMALFMMCERIDAKDAATAHYLARLYTGLNAQDLAAKYTKKAYDLAPEAYWDEYAYRLFREQPKQAIQVVQKQLKRKPDDGDAAQLLQKMYAARGDYKGALKAQDLIDRAEGESIYSVMQRYQLNRQMGKVKQAVQALENYLKKEPDEYYVQVFLGDTYYALGDTLKAIHQYADVEKNYPENPYLPLSMSTYYGEQGDTARAAAYTWQIVESETMSCDYKLDVLKDCKWLNEEQQYEAMLSIAGQYPQEENALLPLERYYKQQLRTEEARELCERIVEINPENKDAWMDLMWMTLVDSANVFQKKDSVIRLVKAHIAEDDAVNRLVVNSSHGDLLALEYFNDTTRHELLEEAFECYETVLRLDPENVYVLNNYAYFLAVTGGDLRKAEKMSQITIRKDAHSATFLDTYAWILHLQGQSILAKMYIQQAMDNAKDKKDKDLIEHYKVINEQ